MPSHLASLLPRTRFGAVMTLALALLAAIAVLAVLSGGRLERRPELQGERSVDPANVVYQLAQQVDLARGLASLHVLAASAAETEALERRVIDHRLVAQRQLAQFERWLSSAEDRAHHAAVKTALAACWTLQDQVLEASRRARGDAEAGVQARRLLAGESQQCHAALHRALDGWWLHLDQRRHEAESRVKAGLDAIAVLAPLAIALLLLAAWLARRGPGPVLPVGAAGPVTRPPWQVSGSDLAQRRQVLRAATEQARRQAAAASGGSQACAVEPAARDAPADKS